MAGKPVLFYMQFAGTAELARLIAAAGGVDLEAGVVPEELEEKTKLCESCSTVGTPYPMNPRALPLMVHGDTRLCQSQAIQQYISLIGPKFSALSPQARAVDMMWCAHLEDAMGDFGKTGISKELFGGNPAFKPEELKTALAKWFDLFERMSPEEGFVNKESFPTAADCLAVVLYEATFPIQAYYAKAGFNKDEYPKFKALSARTAAAPGIKEYMESSTTLKANPFASK